jgi:hypothetical protein
VDSKKRELVGNFKNPGRRWECAPRRVYDHDFRTDSSGVAIPYGIYDVHENRGALVVGISHDTPAFAAHAIAHWWRQEGSQRYTGSRQLLILADTGSSNSCRCHAWKTEVQAQLANSFALDETVAHYPTGASKWNPIEHRLFSEVSRNWAGEPLDSYQKILNYARTTRTQTGLAAHRLPRSPSIRAASSLTANKSRPFDFTDMKLFRSGTTPSSRKCEVVSA